MACNLTSIQTAACVSGIAREQSSIKLLQLIAQLTCEAAESSGGGGGGTPGGLSGQVQFNDAGAFGGDTGLTFDGATNALTVGTSITVPLVASPAATALSFASAGVTRANFTTAGHFRFNTDNTNDIGSSTNFRPRSIYAATSINAGTVSSVSTTGIFVGVNISMIAATGAITGVTLAASTTIRAGGFTVATLPAAGTAGRQAYVTNALAPAFLAVVVGGGAVVTPVFDNGAAWVCG